MTEMGEYLVGAWLKVVNQCDFIQYNARLPGGGREGLSEVDVIGLDFGKKIAYLCEVTTHLHGLGYVDYPTTMRKLQDKFKHDKEYADKVLKDFPTRLHMLWSPVVPKGKLTEQLAELEEKGIELIINRKYAERIEELRNMARKMKEDTGNPAFRLLQILGHIRE